MFSAWLHNTFRSFLLYAIASLGAFGFALLYVVLKSLGVTMPWLLAPIILGFISGLMLWNLGAGLISKKLLSSVKLVAQSPNPSEVRLVGVEQGGSRTTARLIVARFPR